MPTGYEINKSKKYKVGDTFSVEGSDGVAELVSLKDIRKRAESGFTFKECVQPYLDELKASGAVHALAFTYSNGEVYTAPVAGSLYRDFTKIARVRK